MNYIEDTITALATAPGAGAIAVIRVSGGDAFAITDKVFSGKTTIGKATSHTIHYGKIHAQSGEQIDDVLVSVFRAPHSYTGEDSVEISTHGSQLIIKKILELLIQSGARVAEPGEFTKRAFLNNRIDLTQAEAVIEVISARTDASLKGARNQLDGLLSQKVNDLRGRLVNASSLVELELDFAEEDIEFIDRTVLTEKIEEIISEIDALLATYSFGRIIRDGVNVALVGQPNVGKSSLLNYIMKESRAIVSEIPGTTRDVIREEVSIGGLLFRLFDTAGIRPTTDVIEKEGVFRSRDAVKNADIVLFINDVEQMFPEELYQELLNLNSREKIITVFNKSDLPHAEESRGIFVSAKTGKGMDSLFSKLREAAIGSNSYTEQMAIVSNARHYDSLKMSKGSLETTLNSVRAKMSGEFISVGLRAAESSLSEIIGVVTSDDILNNIFSKFCIGK
jgi:tRNA modification GTPase